MIQELEKVDQIALIQLMVMMLVRMENYEFVCTPEDLNNITTNFDGYKLEFGMKGDLSSMRLRLAPLSGNKQSQAFH